LAPAPPTRRDLHRGRTPEVRDLRDTGAASEIG
jgi:hypothetical protein